MRACIYIEKKNACGLQINGWFTSFLNEEKKGSGENRKWVGGLQNQFNKKDQRET